MLGAVSSHVKWHTLPADSDVLSESLFARAPMNIIITGSTSEPNSENSAPRKFQLALSNTAVTPSKRLRKTVVSTYFNYFFRIDGDGVEICAQNVNLCERT